MQPLEVLQIAIEERVFIVPFDFASQHARLGAPHMVNLVRGRLARLSVHDLNYLEVVFLPSHVRKATAKPLSKLRLPPAASDYLGNRQAQVVQRYREFRQCLRKFAVQNRFGMR